MAHTILNLEFVDHLSPVLQSAKGMLDRLARDDVLPFPEEPFQHRQIQSGSILKLIIEPSSDLLRWMAKLAELQAKT